MTDRNRREEFESVWWFSKEMLKKLRENRHKEHWGTMDNNLIIKLMLEEVIELMEASEKEPPENIIKEAADVANFAMMIARNSYLQSTKG